MILCAGEALIDMLPRKTDQGEMAFAPYPGGAVFNTAIGLGRLGQPTGLFTGLSTDLFGKQLEEALTASNVDGSFAKRADKPTTLAFVTLTDGHASYAFYDENTAGRMLGAGDIPSDLTGIDALFLGGISLAVEPCAEAYEALCLKGGKHLPVMIDPNIRPDFIRDEDRYRARIERMIAAADIVKLSDEDLHWLEGAGDTDQLAAKLLAKGPKIFCMTEGAKGVTAYHAGGKTFVAAEKAKVIDTVGAGDTFNAGFLAGLAEAGCLTKSKIADLSEAALISALTLGAKAAAITVSRAGANPPRRDEIA